VNGSEPEEASTIPEIEKTDDESAPKMFEFGGADDYQLKQAINQLEGRPVKKNNPQLVARPKKQKRPMMKNRWAHRRKVRIRR